MIDWHKPKDKLPEHGQKCLLIAYSGLLQGPICYTDRKTTDGSRMRGWMDLFGPQSTSEAGCFIPHDQDGLIYWALASEFNLPKIEGT